MFFTLSYRQMITFPRTSKRQIDCVQRYMLIDDDLVLELKDAKAIGDDFLQEVPDRAACIAEKVVAQFVANREDR